MDLLYKINKYTGEFSCDETEKEFICNSWPVLSRRIFIAVILSSITYFFASCIPRPEVNQEYRALMIPLTRAVAVFICSIAVIIRKSKYYSRILRIIIVLSEIFIGLLESADQYFYLKSINKFYDIGTSFLVFYILIFYIVIPNKIKITLLTSIAISIIFIFSVYLTGIAALSDIFTTMIYFIITNALGYGIVLTANRSKREEYYQGIQLKKAEKEAMEAKLTAEEANSAKSRFLAMMNHEMRTPLNVVLGGIQLLDNEDLPVRQKEILSIVRNSGELLKVMIQNVLDFTNIEKNKLQIRSEPFSLQQMIKEITIIYSHIAEEKGLEFSVSNNCRSAETVTGDQVRLRQVLTNLLNNAVKFTGKGSVSLGIDLSKKEKNKFLVRFSVSDTGIGISEKYFEDILKPFHQVEQSSTRNFDGSGLGLTVSSELLDAMNSKLEITSNPGSGSTFSFNIAFTLHSTVDHNTKEPVIQPYKILLVDDIEANLRIIGGLLESFNQEVVYARGSKQGIEKSLLDHFDAVIIDLHMPEKNGMEAISEIRKNQPGISTFLMTADTREEVFHKFREADLTGFIPKPVDISQLKDTLVKISSSRFATIKNTENCTDCHETIDKTFISELRDDLGDEVYIDIMKSCIETLKKDRLRISKIKNNTDRQDFIHHLSGVAGNYRLMQLWKLLEDYKSGISDLNGEQLKEALEESIKALNNSITPPGGRIHYTVFR